MQPPPRVAVIGTGSLGKEHARIYAEMAAAGEVKFAGVVDTSIEAARAVAERLGIPVLANLDAAAEAADALSVVTPTSTHFATARHLLDRGRHVLVEKPMTDNAADATVLVELARGPGLCAAGWARGTIQPGVSAGCRRWRLNLGSLRRTGCRPTRRGARTSEWCST
jgi:predicted dehydrogenase